MAHKKGTLLLNSVLLSFLFASSCFYFLSAGSFDTFGIITADQLMLHSTLLSPVLVEQGWATGCLRTTCGPLLTDCGPQVNKTENNDNITATKETWTTATLS